MKPLSHWADFNYKQKGAKFVFFWNISNAHKYWRK